MKKLQLIIFLLFIGVNIYAQGPLLPNTFVQPGPDSSGYTGPDMIVFDREGNQYRVSDLIFEKPVNGGGGQSLTTPQTCTAGIFRLHFADFGTGLGFDDPLFPQANVIACQVFTDISQLLNEANSPYTSIPDLGNGAYVEIEVRPSWNNAGNPTLGSCGQYHYQSSPGIVHGSVWQTINSGIDSWFGTNATNLGNFGIYHGLLQVNFGHPFYYGANPSLIPANEYDFYTMILHEAMHGLGFGSLINSNGASKIAPGIYSKYDTFLKENSTGSNLIIDGGCYTQTYNPSVATSNLITPCTIEFAGTNSTFVTTNPPWFGGTSLSHYSIGECGNTGNYVMNPGLASGVTRRFYDIDEVTTLCDLGYSTSGVLATHTYPSSGICGTRVAGVNDFATYTSAAPGVNFSTPFNTNFVLNSNDILDNDENAAFFDCLEVVNNSGSVSLTSGGTGVNITFTPTANYQGFAILKYIPRISQNGMEGNITYVFILVLPPPLPECCNTGSCELICYGGFEEFQNQLQYDLYTQGSFAAGIANAFSFYPCCPGPDNSPDFRNSPQNFPLYSVCPGSPWVNVVANTGNNYVAMVVRNFNGNEPEGPSLPLCQPLLPLETATVTLWTRMGNSTCNGGLQVRFTNFQPCNNNTFLNVCPLLIQSVPVSSGPLAGNTSVWQQVTFTYQNVTGVNLTYLLINSEAYSITAPNIYPIFIDDVSCIKNTPNLNITKTGPTSACPGDIMQYNIEVCNASNFVANNVTLTDVLPTGMTAVAGGTFTFPTQNVGNLAPGACATYTLNAQVNASFGSLTNTVIPASGGCLPNNSQNSTTLTVNPQTLVVTSASSPPNPCPGTNFTVSIDVCNYTANVVNNINIQSVLPSGFVGIPSAGYVINGQDIDFNTFSLAPGTITLPTCTTLVINVTAGALSGTILTSILSGGNVCISQPNQLPIILCNGFTITKTATPSQVYAGAPVDFEIVICNNTGVDQTVLVEDFLPNDFTLFSGVNLLPAGTQIPLPAAAPCTTIHMYGYFSTVGLCPYPDHNNRVTLNHPLLQTQLEANVCVDVLMGCPFMLWGTGTCNVNDVVSVNLTGHTPVPNIYEMNLDIVFPDFLTPPIDFSNETGQFNNEIVNGTSTITNLGTWTGVPTLSGYSRIRLEIIPQNPISVYTAPNFYNWILKLPFTINNNGVPAGQNVFPIFVTSPQSGLYHTDALDAVGGNQIITGGAWTAANYLMLRDCPGVTPLDASFSISQVPCDPLGGVTVNANYNAPGIIHNWTWGDNRTTAINGAATYTYNYYDPICQNTSYNFCQPPYNLPPIPPAPPGTYTITHTVIDLITGTSSTATQQVVLSPTCCTAPVKITHGTTVTGLGVNSLSGQVDVEGDFIIDQDFSFANATVTMEPSAEIIVQGGRNLDVDHSNLSACSNMWKGIKVEADASTRVIFSNLADAQYAINLQDGSTAWITNNTFERNFVGIYAPQSPVDFNNINLYVAENTFKSGSGLVGAYTGQYPSPSSKAFAGIQLHDMVLDLSNPGMQPNIFQDMSNGIVGSRLELDATNCLFKDIKNVTAYNNLTTFNGSGVTDRGGHGYFSVRQVGFGKNAAQATFDNCHYGITGVDINLRSSDNKMTNMDMGYRIDYSSYMSIDINDNLIWSKMNGIDLRYNDFAEHVIVERNEIHFGDPSIVGTKGHSAIQVIEQNGDNPYSIIHDNDIFYNVNSTNARNGIYLNSAANYKVTENTLTMFNNLYNSKGIYSFGSVGTEISCNDILGSSNNYTDKYQSAITVTMNDGPTVACNTVNGTYNGIYFSGPNHHTDVKGNNIHTHVHGVHLDNSAIIGNQDYRGNLWYQAAVGTGVNAVYDNALNALTYTWKVDGTVTIPGSNPVPMTSAPTGWIIPNAGNNFECSQNGGYCNQFFTSGGGNQDFEHQIANGSLQNNPFTDETKWMLKGDLYKRLDENQSLMTGDATLTNFYNQAQTQLLGQFKDIKDVNESLFYLDAAVRNNLNQNKLLLEQKLAQLNADMEQLRATNLTAAQIASIKADISALQIGISNLLNYNKTALGLAATTRILNADNTKVVNDGLYTSEIIEQNEKEINSIYFATIAKGIFTFTSSQASTILGIAEQCPQAGGRAVPVARGFYDMIDESKTYDDPATCLAQGIVLRNAASNIESGLQEKAKEIFRPYFVPNPAKQSATLFYKFDENKTGVLYLSNYLGQLVKTQELKANDNAITITTGSLADGIYHYKVISNGEEVGNGKLAVIK